MADKSPELGDLVEMVGVELRIAQILADRLFAGVQAEGMAAGHYTVLSLIKLNPGINQSSLARCMYLDRSSMVPILDQFEKRGWIERRRHATDRRSHAIYLTRRGKAAHREADQRVRSLEARITEDLGAGNRNRLLSLTRQFQATLLKLGESAGEGARNDS